MCVYGQFPKTYALIVIITTIWARPILYEKHFQFSS